MIEENVLEKIIKLLRMKRGGTTAEVETALFLAQKLAYKHGIDISSVNEDEPTKEPITHDHGQIIDRLQVECKYAAMIAQRFFNIHAVIGRGITFIGTKSNIEIARYVYHFLIKHFRREWKLKKKRLRNRHAFMEGMYEGLWYRLATLEPKPGEKEGLILISNQLAIADYIKKNFGALEKQELKSNSTAKAAHYHGFIAGKNTTINPAIINNEKAALLNQ